jgi:hypothetical protein
LKKSYTIICLCFLLLASLLQAQTVVDNTGEPAEGMAEIQLNELWRTGGEDDEIFFGAVAGAISDAAGKVHILDGQLSQVQVYDADGTWLHSLSREGDGPGEVRQPGGLFMDRGGEICMFHGMAGQIVRVNPDDTPAEAYKYDSEAAQAGGLIILLRGTVAGDGLALAGIRIFFGQPGGSGQQYFLSYCDARGTETKTIMEKMHPIDYSDFRLDELEMDFVWGRWTVDKDGRMYVAPKRNEYSIDVYSPSGELERTFTRDYESYQRNDELKRIARMVIEGVGSYHPVPLQGITIEDTEPDITGMWVARDGTLWVQTSRGDREKPEGAYSVYDVFTPEGKFLKQAALMCDADPSRDSLGMMDDGRIVVVYGILDAWLTQQAVERTEEEQDAQAETPLEVVIYGM